MTEDDAKKDDPAQPPPAPEATDSGQQNKVVEDAQPEPAPAPTPAVDAGAVAAPAPAAAEQKPAEKPPEEAKRDSKNIQKPGSKQSLKGRRESGRLSVSSMLDKKVKQSSIDLTGGASATVLLKKKPLQSQSATTAVGTKPMEFQKQQYIKYMNSYRLDSKHPFQREPVYKIIKDLFNEEFKNVTYEPIIFSKVCATIAAEIRARVKALNFERYKLICIVQICEKNNQSVKSIAKFLWDPERDDSAHYTYESTNFFVSGAVFGIYYE